MPEHDTIDHGPLIHTAFGFKNKIIGGDFHTNPWQRGVSFVSQSGTYVDFSADRWKLIKSGSMAVSVFKTADAPTLSDAGTFTTQCLHTGITTPAVSLTADDVIAHSQAIEGFHAAPFGFGQPGTRYITLSFWVKATKTGRYCVAFRNSDTTRSYVAEYVVNISDTWEKKIITVPVDTEGTWEYSSETGVEVDFTIACGSTFRAPSANTWYAGSYVATANQVNGADSTANDFKLALIQLEEGASATEFEQRSITLERFLCQRYYERNDGTWLVFSSQVLAGNQYYTSVIFRVTKRANATVSIGVIMSSLFPDSGTVQFSTCDGFLYYVHANDSGPGVYIRTWEASAEL